MAEPSTGVYAGVPAEERRAERRARLLAAGLDVLGSEGWGAATVRAICGRAGLTPRYFYESFASREALLLAVFDDIAEQAAARVMEAVAAAPEDATEKARAAVGAFVDLISDDPRKGRVLFSEAIGIEALTRRRSEVRRMFAGLIADQGRRFYRPPEGAERLLEKTALLMAGGLAELLLAWLDGELRASREELVSDTAALLAATGESAAELARRQARARQE